MARSCLAQANETPFRERKTQRRDNAEVDPTRKHIPRAPPVTSRQLESPLCHHAISRANPYSIISFLFPWDAIPKPNF